MTKFITFLLALSLSTFAFAGHCNSGHGDKKAEKKHDSHTEHDHAHESKSEEA